MNKNNRLIINNTYYKQPTNKMKAANDSNRQKEICVDSGGGRGVLPVVRGCWQEGVLTGGGGGGGASVGGGALAGGGVSASGDCWCALGMVIITTIDRKAA